MDVHCFSHWGVALELDHDLSILLIPDGDTQLFWVGRRWCGLVAVLVGVVDGWLLVLGHLVRRNAWCEAVLLL